MKDGTLVPDPEDDSIKCDICGADTHSTNEHYRDIVCRKEMTR